MRKNAVYRKIARVAWTTHTFAGLKAELNAVALTDIDNFVLIKWLNALLQLKGAEGVEQGRLNEDVMAAIINGGGAPTINSYPLKKSAVITGTVAGGAGAFPAATALAAVAGKSLFIEEIILSLTTDTVGGGIQIRLSDGAGGTVLEDIMLSIYQPTVIYRPLCTLTSATLLEWSGILGKAATLDNSDYVKATIKYREI